MTSRYTPNEPVCPVEIETLGLLLRSPESRVSEIVDALPEAQRADLATYCFQRSHMREVGLLIAARCSERSLRIASGPLVGEMLIDYSRAPDAMMNPKKSRITLARVA